MSVKKDDEIVTILSSGNSAIITVASSLLDDAKIKYYIKPDGHDNGSVLSNPPIEIQVDKTNLVKAKNLLADLEEINFEE